MEFLQAAPYVLLLLGGLIFFHELGHFVFARWMGVHVVTFSIGFGPPLMTLKGKRRGPLPPTEYVIAAFPLGGYVRMLGADPTEVIDERHQPYALESKAVWRRFLIMAAGPGFNLLLPYFIYFFVGLTTAQHVPSHVGTVNDSSPAAAAGFKAGDRITSIDGEPVAYWWEVHKYISERPAERTVMTVDRPGVGMVTLDVTPDRVVQVHIPGVLVDEVGRVGITPDFMRASVAIVEGSPAFAAGLRAGDVITAADGQKITNYDELVAVLSSAGSAPLSLEYERARFAEQPGSKPSELFAKSTGSVVIGPGGEAPHRGIASLDCMIVDVQAQTHAAKVGLAPGDILLALDGDICRLSGFLISKLRARPDDEHTLVWASGSTVHRTTQAEWMAVPVPSGPGETTLRSPIFGVAMAAGMYTSPPLVDNEEVFTYAVTHALDATHRAMWMNVSAVIGLLRGDVPVQELSGPVGIAKLASATTEHGWTYFFGLMVWLSISLGLLNLLPIPVLDGGHILFLAIEAVQRRPVSIRTRQIATYAGLAFIILLMVLVLKFDIERVWG